MPLPLLLALVAAVAYASGALLLKRVGDFGVGVWRTAFVANVICALCFQPLLLLGGTWRPELWWQPVVVAGQPAEHELRARVLKPGDMSYLPRGRSNGSRMGPEGSFMLEYCRGPIPTMLPFGLLDSFASTLDFHGIRTTFKVYTRCTLKSLLP